MTPTERKNMRWLLMGLALVTTVMIEAAQLK